jgi:hypothetical protein
MVKIFSNKRAEDGAGMTFTILILTVLAILLIFFAFKMVANIFGNNSEKQPIGNDAITQSIASTLQGIDSTGSNVPLTKIPESEKKIFQTAKYFTKTFTLKKGEFIFFFSSNSKKITLITNNSNKIEKLFFNKPNNKECSEGPCVCYVEKMDLWEFKGTTEGTYSINIDDTKIQNGFDLEKPSCYSIVVSNLFFMDTRGSIKLEEYESFKKDFDKINVPLEIISLGLYKKDDSKANDYLFNKYSNSYANQKDAGVLDFLLQKQKWDGGIILGDMGYSDSSKISTNNYLANVNLNIVKLYFEDKNIVCLGMNTPYCMKANLANANIKDVYYDQLLNIISRIKKTETQTTLAKSIEICKSNELVYLTGINTMYYEASKYKLSPNVTISKKENKYYIDFELNGKKDSFETDVKFIFPDETITSIKITKSVQLPEEEYFAGDKKLFFTCDQAAKAVRISYLKETSSTPSTTTPVTPPTNVPEIESSPTIDPTNNLGQPLSP